MPDPIAKVDVVGVGLNATDTIIRLPRFPTHDSKLEVLSAHMLPGGEVASAMVACQFWGLRTRYVGKVGDDHAASLHRREFERAGVEAHLLCVPDCASQIAFILVDKATGERTILWKRDARLELRPDELRREWITNARALHVDGHGAFAAATAARWAREAGLAVTADVDNIYPGVEELLGSVDYLLASREFPERLTGKGNLLESLPHIAARYACRVAGATLGRHGVLAWSEGRFLYCPGYRVEALDTTGAGDIFHAGFVYALLHGWPLARMLEFSCAAAALNCTALGARGGLRPVAEIERLTREGQRLGPPPDLAAIAQFQINPQGRVG
jgi:sugar/nucleoside kinase (ribokinase family)